MLVGLLDDVLAGDHREGLGYPRLSLDVGLLGVGSAALVHDSLVRIIGASNDWQPLYTTRILLRKAGCSVIRG